jgi:hypothetical protein
MEFKNEEEKIKEWHRSAEEGKKEAITRTRNIQLVLGVILFAFLFLAIGLLVALSYGMYHIFLILF